MSIRNIDAFFRPKSIALIGASSKPKSIGAVVAANLFNGGFSGPIMPVNPKALSINGVLAYPDVKSLPITPDLAVIATNLTGLFNVTKGLFEKFNSASTNKRIINISSVVGLYGNFGQTNYAAAKSGVIGMTKTLGKELDRKSVV